MNRRDVFRFLAGASLLALPAAELLLPARKSFFLPPRGGWWSAPFRMRETQYDILNDWEPMRYDVAGVADGQKFQYFVQWEADYSKFDPAQLERMRIVSREALPKMIPKGAKFVQLPLPRQPSLHACYV